MNANASVKNIAQYDILCTKDEKNVAFIQVKTTKETTFPVGISIGKAKDKSFLNEHIIGPWGGSPNRRLNRRKLQVLYFDERASYKTHRRKQ